MDIWEHKRHKRDLVLYLPHKDTSVYTARYHKLQFHRLERHTVVYHHIMYRNLSDFKDQCIACNYCKRFLMYLYIDRRHLSLIDPSRWMNTITVKEIFAGWTLAVTICILYSSCTRVYTDLQSNSELSI